MDQGKLRSLMFHAGFCNEDGGWDSRPICEQEHDNFQRFAELIVRECVKVVDDTMTENQEMNIGLVMASAAIVAHFGVEE